MRIRTFGSVIALSSAATVVVTACGDDTTVRTTEPCEAGTNECVSDKVGRACPEGPEPGWVYFACGENELCRGDGVCELDPAAGGLLGLCDEGDKECVSDALARQCAKGGDSWLPLPCPSGTVCNAGDCVPAADGGGVQICTPGAVECATEQAVKTCQNDGSEWVLTLCEAGQVCQAGACVTNENQACIPNTSQCLDQTNGLRCREDGAGYEPFECPEEAPCEGFKCMGTVCSPGESKCDDPGLEFGGGPFAVAGHVFAGSNLYTCNDAGDGWDVNACDIDQLCIYNSLTPAEVGAYENLFIDYYGEYVAADNEDNAPLPVAPTFIHPPNRFMQASCILPDCEFSLGSVQGEIMCGDPSTPSSDPATYFSRCQGLPPFSAPQWVPYSCEAPEMCDPNSFNFGDPCSTDCIPGERVCGEDFGLDSDSVYGCSAEGKWEPQESCNPGTDKALTCHNSSTGEIGSLRSAMCVDPLCDYIWNAYGNDSETIYGLCNGEEIITCDDEGLLNAENSMACPSGQCIDAGGNNPDQDNQIVGWCEEECMDGELKCMDGNAMHANIYGWMQGTSPFYLECLNGVWNRAEPQACTDGNLCFQFWQYAQEDEKISDIQCGGVCQPGFRQCNAEKTGIETCNSQAQWGEASPCDVGVCINEPDNEPSEFPGDPIGNDVFDSDHTWDAECVFECVPGTYQSSYLPGLNVDGGTDGNYYGESLCGEDGRWGDVKHCDDIASVFRVNSQVGCFECYGPELAAYKSQLSFPNEVAVESMCGLDGTIMWCGNDNTWPDEGEDCPQGQTCFPYSSGQYNNRALCDTEPPPPPSEDAGSTDAGDGG